MRSKSMAVAIYIGVLFCFFLPWVQVSCGVIKVDASAYELASRSLQDKFELTTSPELLRERVSEAVSSARNLFWVLFLIPILGVFGLLIPLRLFSLHKGISVLLIILPMACYAYYRVHLYSEMNSSEAEFGRIFFEIRPLVGAWLTALLGVVNLGFLVWFQKQHLAQRGAQMTERGLGSRRRQESLEAQLMPDRVETKKSLAEQAAEIRQARKKRNNRAAH